VWNGYTVPRMLDKTAQPCSSEGRRATSRPGSRKRFLMQGETDAPRVEIDARFEELLAQGYDRPVRARITVSGLSHAELMSVLSSIPGIRVMVVISERGVASVEGSPSAILELEKTPGVRRIAVEYQFSPD
jgi:hypothetical protein